ncbi:hypothetical protein ACFQ3W_11360 [Paenibacillus puldeungensis]|uniref:Uncharacterized protein n=1 Tax=Paenibacillus puldeungensis TaxID=696536 RepID=A0ABW3RXG2_9BACL
MDGMEMFVIRYEPPTEGDEAKVISWHKDTDFDEINYAGEENIRFLLHFQIPPLFGPRDTIEYYLNLETNDIRHEVIPLPLSPEERLQNAEKENADLKQAITDLTMTLAAVMAG